MKDNEQVSKKVARDLVQRAVKVKDWNLDRERVLTGKQYPMPPVGPMVYLPPTPSMN